MLFVALLLTALGIRLFLSPLGFHIDIFSNAGWGEWIYQNGPLGFYENTTWLYSWPTQPPFVSLLYGFDRLLYQWLLEFFRWIGNTIVYYHLAPGHMRWWFFFTIWFDTAKINPVSAFQTGYLVTIKLLPILADLGIAYAIYIIAKSQRPKLLKSQQLPTPFFPLLYLFSPFTIYLSSLWGQYDQLAFLPLLISFFFLALKQFMWFTPVLFALSIAIKPTGLVFMPLFLYLFIRHSQISVKSLTNLKRLIVPIFLISLFFYLSTSIFTSKPLFEFLPDLYQKIFLKAEMRLTTNAFNFWRIFVGNRALSSSAPFLFIPAWAWGIAMYVTLHLKIRKLLKKPTLQSIFSSLFVIAAGSFLFLTNMLDRYFFAGIVSGLIVCIWHPKLLKYWFILSIIFFLNLYNQWWFPEIALLKVLLEWNNAFVTRILSLIGVIAFIVIVRRLLLVRKVEV